MEMQYVQGHPFFTKTNKLNKQYNYLTEDISTDVVVIGGGVTGSIVGYYLTKNNIKTVILEKNRIAYGSTSITTALLQYELDSNLSSLTEYTTKENVITSYKLGLKALDELDKFIKQYGNKCRYKKRDTLLYTAKKIEQTEILEEFEARKNAGIDVQYIDENQTIFDFDIKAGIIGCNGGAEVDPYLFTHQLLDVACKQGMKVYENTKAEQINYVDDHVEIITKYGNKIIAKKVVIATGYDTDEFTQRNFGVKTITYNVVTKPLDEKIKLPRVLIRDNNDPYNYFRTTEDNRIIAGGEDIPFIEPNFTEGKADEKYRILEDRLKTIYKASKNVEIDYKYCGAFCSSQDNLGFIGKEPKHDYLWYCLGYGANGILFAILGGMFLSKLYKGETDENLHLFRVDRFDGK